MNNTIPKTGSVTDWWLVMIMHNVNVTKSKENVPDEKNAQCVEIIFEEAVTVLIEWFIPGFTSVPLRAWQSLPILLFESDA